MIFFTSYYQKRTKNLFPELPLCGVGWAGPAGDSEKHGNRLFLYVLGTELVNGTAVDYFCPQHVQKQAIPVLFGDAGGSGPRAAWTPSWSTPRPFTNPPLTVLTRPANVLHAYMHSTSPYLLYAYGFGDTAGVRFCLRACVCQGGARGAFLGKTRGRHSGCQLGCT